MGISEVAETIHKIEQFNIRVYEGGGEVWYDVRKNLSDDERIRLGLYSRKVQQNKQDFVEFLWRRDKWTPRQKEGEKIVQGMCGLRGLRTI